MTTQTEAQRLAAYLDAMALDPALCHHTAFTIVEKAAAELLRLEAAKAELLEALNHAVEIAEARRPGVWDDLLQYRAAIKKHGCAA